MNKLADEQLRLLEMTEEEATSEKVRHEYCLSLVQDHACGSKLFLP